MVPRVRGSPPRTLEVHPRVRLHAPVIRFSFLIDPGDGQARSRLPIRAKQREISRGRVRLVPEFSCKGLDLAPRLQRNRRGILQCETDGAWMQTAGLGNVALGDGGGCRHELLGLATRTVIQTC